MLFFIYVLGAAALSTILIFIASLIGLSQFWMYAIGLIIIGLEIKIVKKYEPTA